MENSFEMVNNGHKAAQKMWQNLSRFPSLPPLFVIWKSGSPLFVKILGILSEKGQCLLGSLCFPCPHLSHP